MGKEIKVNSDVGVFVFVASCFIEDVEAMRQQLKKQIEEGVVLVEPTIEFKGCFQKGEVKNEFIKNET